MLIIIFVASVVLLKPLLTYSDLLQVPRIGLTQSLAEGMRMVAGSGDKLLDLKPDSAAYRLESLESIMELLEACFLIFKRRMATTPILLDLVWENCLD